MLKYRRPFACGIFFAQSLITTFAGVERVPANYIILLRRIGLLLFIYFLCRLLFLIFNFPDFSSNGFIPVVRSFFFGIRYDITAIVISNILFISLHLLPFRFFYLKFFQRFLKALFFLVNVPFILLSCIDFGLFRFTGKRSGEDIIGIMGFGNDFINTVPSMVADFWYLVIIFFILIYLIVKFYPTLSVIKSSRFPTKKYFFYSVPGKIILFLFFSFLTFTGFRGGIQYKPLNILSASRYGSGKSASLVLNTPFTVIKTYGKQRIEEIHWMSEKESVQLTPVIKFPKHSVIFEPKNVIIIILESFGKEYIGSLNNYKGYTPFLDSLISRSLVFPNAYANGKRSIEGIPAIVAGIPALMSDPFIISAYSGNSITSIPSLLKTKGYSSVFFHGGTDGTMGFDNFSRLAGFDRYFGRTEYNDDDDFDGSWGIYDEPFLQRMIVELNKINAPFFATVFTLSSHHPYSVPSKYAGKFPKGTLPIHESVGYADFSLRKFFETASKTSWFKNTLFVITADHTALSEYPFYRNHVGLFAIPVIYYSPNDSLLAGKNMLTTQQIDILPSVMDYLGYDKPFYSLGNSVFQNSGNAYAVNSIDETFQLIKDDYNFIMGASEKNSLYDFETDTLMKKNLAGKDSVMAASMDLKLKSVIQNFNRAIIHNEMK